MENKCLVTKLSGLVNNPNLPYIDEILFEYDGSSFGSLSYANLRIKGTGILEKVSGKWYTDSSVQTEISSNQVSASANQFTTVYIKKGERVKIRFRPVGEIVELGDSLNSNLVVNFKDLLRIKNGARIIFTPFITTGTLESLIESWTKSIIFYGLAVFKFSYIKDDCIVTFNSTRLFNVQYEAVYDTGTNSIVIYSDSGHITSVGSYNIENGEWTYV